MKELTHRWFSATVSCIALGLSGLSYCNSRETRLGARAWLALPPIIQSYPPLVAGQSPTTAIIIKNYGQTIAQNIYSGTGAAIVEPDKFKPYYPAPQTTGTGAVGPGETLSVGPSRMFRPITQDLYDDIYQGRKRLFIFGQILYEDVFKISHSTEWCLQYFPEGQAVAFCNGYNTLK